jgi:hypothetical protein
MEGTHPAVARGILAGCLTAALVLFAASAAHAFSGDTHLWAGQQATWLFTHGVDQANPMCITEYRDGWPIYPELLLQSTGWDPNSSYDPGADDERTFTYYNWEWIAECSKRADMACVATLNHFWLLSDGLHDDPGYNTYNSWEVSYNLWVQAIDAWNAGDLAWAYTSLGYCMHHIQDMLQPAHSNDDLHPGGDNDDCIEEWFLDTEWFGAKQMFSWDLATGPRPPDVIPTWGSFSGPTPRSCKTSTTPALPMWRTSRTWRNRATRTTCRSTSTCSTGRTSSAAILPAMA